jgi:hypothetical protein
MHVDAGESKRRAGDAASSTDRSIKRLDRIIFKIRTLLKVMLAKFVYEDFMNNATRTGEAIISRERNFKVDGHVIDLVIETTKAVYIIDIESAPRRRHVDKLLIKATLAQKIFVKPIKPILVGVRVNSDVEEYARSRGVEIFKY